LEEGDALAATVLHHPSFRQQCFGEADCGGDAKVAPLKGVELNMAVQNTIEAFYDSLAPYYRLLYPDWRLSVVRQASLLDAVIREVCGTHVRQVLDAACGIGTQTLGLAELGYHLTASDISSAEIERARAEANRRGLTIDFCAADMRQLWKAHQRQFDVVIACDNAIPHLLSDADILLAFEQFYRCTVSGGGCIISVRDYATMERGGRQFYPRPIHDTDQGRMVLFDIWEFEGDCYDLTTYVLEDCGQDFAQTHVVRGGRYYCVTIETLERLFRQAGFIEVRTLKERFFQPLIVTLKA
jgi:SAM-dependent methyltransferase